MRGHLHANARNTELELADWQDFGKAISKLTGSGDIHQVHFLTRNTLTHKMVVHINMLAALGGNRMLRELDGTLIDTVQWHSTQCRKDVVRQ